MNILKIAKSILNDIDKVREVIDKVLSIKDYLISLTLEKEISEKEFYQITSMLTPQSRSSLWEKYYIKKHNGKKIKATENSGDFIIAGKVYEYKASGFNVDNVLHLVQIRIWQDCNYLIQSIQKERIYTFDLSHKQMKKELSLCHAASAHGTRKANYDNKNIELRLTIDIGGQHWKRWLKNYQV